MNGKVELKINIGSGMEKGKIFLLSSLLSLLLSSNQGSQKQ